MQVAEISRMSWLSLRGDEWMDGCFCEQPKIKLVGARNFYNLVLFLLFYIIFIFYFIMFILPESCFSNALNGTEFIFFKNI